jgi:hypothetical protein
VDLAVSRLEMVQPGDLVGADMASSARKEGSAGAVEEHYGMTLF